METPVLGDFLPTLIREKTEKVTFLDKMSFISYQRRFLLNMYFCRDEY
jgi:hypothetical protein